MTEQIDIRKSMMQDKVDSLIHANRDHITVTLNKIESDAHNLEDMVVPLGKHSMVDFHANGDFKVVLEGERYGLHRNALQQLSYLYGIPGMYSRKLVETDWGRELLKKTFRDHNMNSSRRHMLFRSVDQEVRGVVSDSYRRLDSRLILQAFMNEAKNRGATFVDALYTDVKSYMTVIYPKVFEIDTPNNGRVYSVFGARISNSDFGQASLSISNFQMNVICLNGMIGTSSLSVKHLGKRLDPNLQLSQRTYELDSRTMASAVRDITRETLSEDVLMATARKMREASEKIIDMDVAIKRLPKEILKSEVESIKSILQNGDEERGVYGKPTLWKLSQAITSAAVDIGGERKRELHEIAGKMLKL